MAAVTAPLNPPAVAAEPNYAALAARYDSEDECESDGPAHTPTTQPELHHVTPDHQQQQQQQPTTAAAADDDGAYAPDEGGEGFEEYSDEGDEDDELYAALEWADSREGRQAAAGPAAAPGGCVAVCMLCLFLCMSFLRD